MVPINYDLDVCYLTFPGRIPIAKAGADGSACVMAKVAAERWEKHVKWQARCVGAPPPLPDFLTRDPNLVLLDSWFSLGNPGPIDDRSMQRTAKGWYQYAYINPPNRSRGDFKTAFTIFWDGAKTVYLDGSFRQDIIDW